MHWSVSMRTWWLVWLSGCAAVRPVAPRPIEPAPIVVAVIDAGVIAEELDAGVFIALVDEALDAGAAIAEVEEEEETGPTEEPGEASLATTVSLDAGWVYSADLSDEALAAAWKNDLRALGSISMGFVEEGRLINGQPFPEGEAWKVVQPEGTWATQETIDFVTAAIRQVKEWHPAAPALRVNQISAREGGFLRPHKTHQNGRDVDLGFYYPGGETIRTREREKVIDPALNWALVKALLMHGDVQFILVDRRVQQVLYDFAKRSGEDVAWLDTVFFAGPTSMLHHARRHRDHFHVRFFNARAQELGRRVAPLLAERPEENIAMHRVRGGDTLGGIASRYGSGVTAIQRANGLSGTMLRIGRVLKVPLRKPCTSCPVPPPTIVPPRRLPPVPAMTAIPERVETGG